jgi:hypothetical protein
MIPLTTLGKYLRTFFVRTETSWQAYNFFSPFFFHLSREESSVGRIPFGVVFLVDTKQAGAQMLFKVFFVDDALPWVDKRL